MATNKKFLDFYYNKKKYYKELIEKIDVTEEQKNYTNVYFDGGYGYKPEESRRWIVNNTSLPKFRGTCLDVGSGDGYWSWILSEWYNVTGIDPLSGPVDLSNLLRNILPAEIKNNTQFIVGDALTHVPKEKYDVIHSMEVLYYLDNPKEVIKKISNSWLEDNGRLIIGIDHYYENTASHSWQDKVGTRMLMFNEKEWILMFKEAGLQNVQSWRANKSSDWEGTLVITGVR